MAAGDVTRVVQRCEQASENGHLDLSHCLLTSFPDAIFHLMRHVTVKSCDLSHNELKRIPTKLAHKFTHLNVLNLSSNKFSKLPDTLSQLANLHTLDVSDNRLDSFPASIAASLPKLKVLKLYNNNIRDVDRQCLTEAAANSLVDVNLENNPLSRDSRAILSEISEINVKISDVVDNYDCLD